MSNIGWRDPRAMDASAGWRNQPARSLQMSMEFCAECWGQGRTWYQAGNGEGLVSTGCRKCRGRGFRWVA